MKFLFDSNSVIALLKENSALISCLQKYRPQDFGISVIVAYELFYGAFKSQRVVANLARVDSLQFEMLDFDREDARMASELRAKLASLGLLIGPYDILIAGQALARNLTLITHNTREFERVPHLRIEDWESS